MKTVASKTSQASTETLAFEGPCAPIHVTFYKGSIGKKDQGHKPAKRREYESWGAYVEALRDAVAVEAKQLPPFAGESTADTAKRIKNSLPYLGPYRLRPDADRRNDANVEYLTQLVLDGDRCDLLAVLERLEALDVAAVVYTTSSDHPGLAETERKFRVVCPVSRHILPSECAYTRTAFAEALGLAPGCGQEQVKSPHLGFYAGRVPGTPEREVIEAPGSAPINVDALLARPLRYDWGRRSTADGTTKPADKSPLPPIGDVAPRDEPVLAALQALHLPPGEDFNRRMHMRATGSYLAKRGRNDIQITALVSRIETANEPMSNVAQAIEGARDQRRGVENVAGWKQLKALNAAAADALDRALDSKRERSAREADDARRAQKAAKVANDTGADSGAKAYNPPDNKEEGEAESALGKRHAFSDPEVPIDYLCDGLRLAPSDGKISIIAGDPGGGKGPIANHLAVCFALGLKAFGTMPCKQTNVLLLDCEGARLTMRRLRRLARGAGRQPEELDGRLYVFDASAAELVSDAYLEALKAFVAMHSIGAVVLDSYTSAMLATGLDANKPEFALLAKHLGQLGVLVLAVAHANKEAAKDGKEPKLSSVAYSGAFAAMAQTAIVVSYPDPNDRNTIRVGCARAPETGFASFVVRFADMGPDALQVTAVAQGAAQAARAEAVAVEHQETVARRADAIERILARDDSGRGIGTTALKLDAGLSGATWPEARDECLRRGSILQGTGYKTGSIAWSYVPPDRRPTPEPLGAKLRRERATRDKGQQGQ